jgi:hypothetical protein
MTNGAHYTRGMLYHNPWHIDIRTAKQLNTICISDDNVVIKESINGHDGMAAKTM